MLTPLEWRIKRDGKQRRIRNCVERSTFIWRPPWARWNRLVENAVSLRGETFTGDDETSDTFIWRPPWVSLRRMFA